MPSGRCTASTLITSAPIAASHAVANGPAQNAVKSSTFSPRADARRRRPAVARAAARAATARRRRVGRGERDGRATPWNRNGARGRIQSRRVAARTRRARRAVRSAAARRRCRRSSPGRARRRTRRRPRRPRARVVQLCRMPFTSSARPPRPIIVVELVVVGQVVAAHRRGTSASHCCVGDGRDADVAAVGRRLVARDHHPPERHRPAAREAGHERRRRHERHLHRFEHRHVDVLGHAGTRRPPPRGRRAERRERAGDVLAEAAADRQRRAVRVPVAREAAAARLQHLLGEVEAVVGTAVADAA